MEALGHAALFLAVGKGDVATAAALLAAKADVNAANKYGLTPLHAASTGGHPEIARLLLASGARVDAADARGFTARGTG